MWIVKKKPTKKSTTSPHTLFPQGMQRWGMGCGQSLQPLPVSFSSPYVQLPLHGHINRAKSTLKKRGNGKRAF